MTNPSYPEIIVERVARAMWDQRRIHSGWSLVKLELWGDGKIPKLNGIMEEARAALKAANFSTSDGLYPKVEIPPFITALKNGGTKEEAIFALERMWEDQCGLRSALEELTSEVAPTIKSENRLTQRLGNALLRARRVLASLDGQSHSGGA